MTQQLNTNDYDTSDIDISARSLSPKHARTLSHSLSLAIALSPLQSLLFFFLQYIRMLTILLSRCRCCPFTPAASDSASASAGVAVVVVASSALAARLNGRGLRFLKRKRNSVFRTRIAASHTPRTNSPQLSLSLCVCVRVRVRVYRGERRDGGMGHGNWSKRINDSQINYNVYIDIDFFLFL